MSSLYVLDSDILMLLENGFTMACVDENGEIDEEKAREYLETLPIERDRKLEAYGMVIKNYQADIDAIKAEEANLKARRQAKEKQVERLKEAVASSMNLFEQPKFETPKVVFTFRKSQQVEVDLAVLDKQYIKEKIEYSADKTAIKKAIVAGEVIEGATLVIKQNLQVK